MDAVRANLVRRDLRLVLLLAPPFDRAAEDPGYIRGYPPGLRENGGQYTHAAVWMVMAVAKQGRGDEAVELFHMLNPVNHTRTARGRGALQGGALRPVRRRVRPSRASRPRGVVLVHRLRGLALPRGAGEHPGHPPARARSSRSIPCIPSSWPEYTVDLALRAHALRDHGREPEPPVAGASRQAELDGAAVDPAGIPLPDDGGTHHVHVVLGAGPAGRGGRPGATQRRAGFLIPPGWAPARSRPRPCAPAPPR